MDTTLINCKICEKEFDSIYEIDEGICDECQENFEKTFKGTSITKKEKIKIAKDNEHIPTNEIKQDIEDTEVEIVIMKREMKAFNLLKDRMSMMKVSARKIWKNLLKWGKLFQRLEIASPRKTKNNYN